MYQELHDYLRQADTWDSLGYAHHRRGDHPQAIACYQHALDLFRNLGAKHYEAETLTRLGDTHHAVGDPETARVVWQCALNILTDLDHPDASPLRISPTLNPAL